MEKPKAKVLYITYLGLLEPIPKSQVLPYLFELSKDVKIHLLSFEKKWLIKKEPPELKQIEYRLREKGIVWKRLTYHKYPLIISSILDILLGISVTFFLIVRYKISIVHARSNIPIAIGYILKTFLPIKLLYDRRGIMGEDHIEHSGWKKNGLLYHLAVWFENFAIRRSDAIVVLTNRMNTGLHCRFAFKEGVLLKTIPCCIQPYFFWSMRNQDIRKSLGISDKTIVFVYSGSVGTYNLLAEMLDFFLEVKQMVGNAHFFILTQNKELVNTLLAQRQDLDKNSFTVSFISHEDLPRWLSAADVGLVFRKSSPTAIAACPTKFSEYLACGLPVVSTPKIGDLEEIINTHRIGVVLDGRYGKSEYRRAISKLLSLLRERDVLGERCRKVARDIFSLKNGVEAYLDIYNHLINS